MDGVTILQQQGGSRLQKKTQQNQIIGQEYGKENPGGSLQIQKTEAGEKEECRPEPEFFKQNPSFSCILQGQYQINTEKKYKKNKNGRIIHRAKYRLPPLHESKDLSGGLPFPTRMDLY